MSDTVDKNHFIETSVSYRGKTRKRRLKPLYFVLSITGVILLIMAITITISVTTPFLSRIGIVGGIMSRHDFVTRVMGTGEDSRQNALWEYYTDNGRDSVITRENLIRSINTIDSLEMEVMLWELYSDNISRILSGSKRSLTADSLLMTAVASVTNTTEASVMLDTMLRRRVLADIGTKERLNRRGEFQNMFRPVAGPIVKHFNRSSGRDITIATQGVQPVYAITGGIVMLTTWSPYYGYLIMIQHGGGIISLYSNISQLMVKEGNVVSAGAVIGYIGKEGAQAEEGDESHLLHFSMWHEGNGVDPETFISF